MIFDWAQFYSAVEDIDQNTDREESDTPVLARAGAANEETYFDILGLEYDPEEDVVYLNLGVRR